MFIRIVTIQRMLAENKRTVTSGEVSSDGIDVLTVGTGPSLRWKPLNSYFPGNYSVFFVGAASNYSVFFVGAAKF